MIDSVEIARRIETHEARAWSACVEAAILQPGNPLKADVELRGNCSVSALAALDLGHFNRVIGLGVETPATEEDIVAVQDFYRARSQSRYVVEITPISLPETMGEWLNRHGLNPVEERIAKTCRFLKDLPPLTKNIDVRELLPSDRDEWSAVNVAAWGMPSFFKAWFGATLGREGFRHYGAFHGDLLVSTGAIYVTGDIAWSGYSATRPEYRGKGCQTATHVRRLHDAAAMGCTLVHSEVEVETPEKVNPSLRSQIKVGFHRIYDKSLYAPFE